MSFAKRLLAQAVRQQEEQEGFSADSVPLERQLASSRDSIEQRILSRASQLDHSTDLRHALDRLQGYSKLFLFFALALTAIIGALAVNQAFVRSPVGTVNFFWLLLSLLGINILALMIWVVAMLVAPGAAQRGSIAAALLSLLRRLLPRLSMPYALGALLRVYSSGALLRWLLATLVQAIWVAYLLGGLLMVLLQLLTRQFDFVWETTLLGEQTYIAVTGWLSALPEGLGFDTLTPEQIAASRLGSDFGILASTRSQWAVLLLVCLLGYGLVPRILLLLFCWHRLRVARKCYRLDLFEPYFISLQQRLRPVSRQLGVVDADEMTPATADIDPGVIAHMPPGSRPVAWLGLDMLEEQRGWPAEGHPQPQVLGSAVDRESRESLLAAVKQLGSAPLVIEVLLNCSPDRGIAGYLKQMLHERQNSSTWLVVSGWRAASRQLAVADLEQRVWDWHRLAGEAGLLADHIVHLDDRPASRAGEAGR